MNNLKIFSGTSNPKLAREIAYFAGVNLGEVYIHQFPSNESFSQIKENVRGDDVYLIQTACFPANEMLMEILVMADAARRAGAERITLLAPKLFYSRQDRKTQSRTPISAKLMLNMCHAAGINRIITMDLHSPQVAGMTDDMFDNLYFKPVLLKYIKENFIKHIDAKNIVIVSPDVGGVKRAEEYCKSLNTSMAFIVKNRLGDEHVEIETFVGDIANKQVFMVDDMVESAKTLIQAAEACKQRGATNVICAVTHGSFTENGKINVTKALNNKIIDTFIVSNTIDLNWENAPANLIELSVGDIFGRAICNIHNNQSVSELFE